MKNHLILLLAFVFATPAFAGFSDDPLPPHIRKLIAESGQPMSRSEHPIVNRAVEIGVRNTQWLKLINEHRAPEKQIPLSDPLVRNSYPMTAPAIYSPATIQATFDQIAAALPEPMKKVLWENQPLTSEVPVAEDVYIQWMRKIDKLYSTATRWQMMEPWLDYFTEQKRNDLRGYYFLSTMPKLDETLEIYDELTEISRERIRKWLLQICMNTELQTDLSCRQSLDEAIQTKSLVKFKNRFWKRSRSHWESYFRIGRTRSDFQWRSDRLVAPFRTPATDEITRLLGFIETGMKLKDWFVDLVFSPSADVRVQFLPGVTPHVNELAGNIITMDANVPVLDPDNEFVIQHEFGHILGFPDCYIEFYDTESAAMINYQLDVEDMMCSRAGSFSSRHVNELGRAYSH